MLRSGRAAKWEATKRTRNPQNPKATSQKNQAKTGLEADILCNLEPYPTWRRFSEITGTLLESYWGPYIYIYLYIYIYIHIYIYIYIYIGGSPMVVNPPKLPRRGGRSEGLARQRVQVAGRGSRSGNFRVSGFQGFRVSGCQGFRV